MREIPILPGAWDLLLSKVRVLPNGACRACYRKRDMAYCGNGLHPWGPDTEVWYFKKTRNKWERECAECKGVGPRPRESGENNRYQAN